MDYDSTRISMWNIERVSEIQCDRIWLSYGQKTYKTVTTLSLMTVINKMNHHLTCLDILRPSKKEICDYHENWRSYDEKTKNIAKLNGRNS
jgi:hypothetical protein